MTSFLRYFFDSQAVRKIVVEWQGGGNLLKPWQARQTRRKEDSQKEGAQACSVPFNLLMTDLLQPALLLQTYEPISKKIH